MGNRLLGKLLGRNKAGGIDPINEHDLERSKAHDLITLAPDIEGTNCSNCKFIDHRAHKCKNEHLSGISVNERMCCSLWDRVGSIRPWKKETDGR